MGWLSKNGDFGYNSSSSGDVSQFHRSSGGGDDSDRCATRKVVRSQCRTEEIEPGKFVRKCEKTEQIFKDCVGRPTEMVESNKEYTEEDVTDQMVKAYLVA
ncbi:fra a 1-associated protein-like isoform X2 [Salvia splendens]|uniref:fra a 1-associated protein-like isoform X2 n=1 Tax=Salvia splendens TaxID=180675 RepID=UPI001C275D9F|nr:fra a 1-associated protein-like isoform X2 [Salvia splendens]